MTTLLGYFCTSVLIGSHTKPLFSGFLLQVLGESMAGISHNAKNSNLPEFGDSVSSGSKALCGLTEAAAQVKVSSGGCEDRLVSLVCVSDHTEFRSHSSDQIVTKQRIE